MGGAVFAALDGETNFATVPERVELALRGALGGIVDRLPASARKTDRLPPAGESVIHRQVIKVTTTSRTASNREIVRVRPFVRVAGNLSLTTSELSANIPPFNPQRMLAESAAPGTAVADDPGAEPDAEVSFVTHDLALLLPRVKIAAVLPIDDVLARVRDVANWVGGAKPQGPGGDFTPNIALAYAADGHPDPYVGFETRIVPENISLLPKTDAQTSGGNGWTERTVTVKKGDSVGSVLRDLGATPDEIKQVNAALGSRGRDGGMKEGQKLRVLMAPTSDPKHQLPIRVVIASDNVIEAAAAWSEAGKYVSVDVANMNTPAVAEASEDEQDDGRGVRLYQSIYETALRNQVPRPVIDDLIRIYSYDVDFQRKVQPGDSFELLFAGEDEGGGEGKSDVLFAALTTGGDTKKFYRFQSPDDGVVDYYDETGKSAKKFLVRKPVAEGLITSGFGERNHPLLHFSKMHTGVDWGAPTGTPIFASGNGTVEEIGLKGGYGKYIRIRHANGYQTAYGHLSAFARNLEEGKRVRQGQVIGYVGSTGLSTGSHLHYEILVNGRFVDPMRIRLPRGRVLEGPLLAGFDQERARLDNLMTRGGAPAPRVAQSTAQR
jgi:murein DD-endopeptidase MepM/ murein hydrolase activator NlpD